MLVIYLTATNTMAEYSMSEVTSFFLSAVNVSICVLGSLLLYLYTLTESQEIGLYLIVHYLLTILFYDKIELKCIRYDLAMLSCA